MKLLSFLLLTASLLGVSCERHDFEGPNGTKQLHQHAAPGGHHGDDAAAHPEKSSH